jgi:hypothetical protein
LFDLGRVPVGLVDYHAVLEGVDDETSPDPSTATPHGDDSPALTIVSALANDPEIRNARPTPQPREPPPYHAAGDAPPQISSSA